MRECTTVLTVRVRSSPTYHLLSRSSRSDQLRELILRCTVDRELARRRAVSERHSRGIQRPRRTLAEDIQRELDDEQQHTATRGESQDLRHEALVQGRGALFAEDRDQSAKFCQRARGPHMRERERKRTRGRSSCTWGRLRPPCSRPVCATSRHRIYGAGPITPPPC